MASAGTVFECSIANRRLAEAQSIGELDKEWQTAQQNFQKVWERKNHKLLMFVHDGFGEIGDNDVVDALATIGSLDKNQPLDVILHTHGGDAPSTMQIAEVLVHRPRTTTFVPIFAHSGGTMIALSTEKIHLAKGAALGPVDLQIETSSYRGSARQFIEIVNQLGDDAGVPNKVFAEDVKKLINDHAKSVCAAINRRHKGFLGWRGCDLATKLTKGDMLHSQAINFSTAKRLHMNVVSDIPKSVYALINVRLTQLRRLRELQRVVHHTVDEHAA